MICLAWLAHYKNKYRGGEIRSSGDSLDVYDAQGNHALALRKDGHGNFVCLSDDHGCEGAHDLAPLPLQACLWEESQGSIQKVEDFDERSAFMASSAAKALVDSNGRVKSQAEIGKRYFDDKGAYIVPLSVPASANA